MDNTSKQKPDCQATPRRLQRLVRHLDLFSGIGGFALAAQWVGGIETIGFCEIDEWAQKVLKKNFPGVPMHDDVKTLDPNNYGRIDLITGGYPCQPFSLAGSRKGESDDRHLWPEVFRIIKQARPRWVLCENVTGHVEMGLDEVLSDLAGEGYTAEPILIPACAVGADHVRERVWIIAHADDSRLQASGAEGISRGKKVDRGREMLEHLHTAAISIGCDGWKVAAPKPGIPRVHDGIPKRVDRNRGLGNAIVPQVAAEILRVMMTVDNLPNSVFGKLPTIKE